MARNKWSRYSYASGTKNKIVRVDRNYFRPLEVDTLLGDASKAKKELRWKPKKDIKDLVKEMVYIELQNLQKW